jgi:hypothetical protein
MYTTFHIKLIYSLYYYTTMFILSPSKSSSCVTTSTTHIYMNQALVLLTLLLISSLINSTRYTIYYIPAPHQENVCKLSKLIPLKLMDYTQPYGLAL